uniref:Transmembrane protein n=1 Tax=Steinernema glaseri TaxID=37863 RepID=A0A1I8AQR5_9BILA
MPEPADDPEKEALRHVSVATQTLDSPPASFDSLLGATFSTLLAAVITWPWILRPESESASEFQSLDSIPSSFYVTPPMSASSTPAESPERTPLASPEPPGGPLSPTSISSVAALLETDSMTPSAEAPSFGMFERYRVPPYRREANRSFYPEGEVDASAFEEFEAFEIPGGVALQQFLQEVPPLGYLDSITEQFLQEVPPLGYLDSITE